MPGLPEHLRRNQRVGGDLHAVIPKLKLRLVFFPVVDVIQGYFLPRLGEAE
jgi:hypothetical protein